MKYWYYDNILYGFEFGSMKLCYVEEPDIETIMEHMEEHSAINRLDYSK